MSKGFDSLLLCQKWPKKGRGRGIEKQKKFGRVGYFDLIDMHDNLKY